MKALYLLSALFFFFSLVGVPIETPPYPERNKFVIKCPYGWGYRTFKGENGLIGVLWPQGSSFNDCDTAVFVFIQNLDMPLPEEPDNGHLFSEKCPKSTFKFANIEDADDPSLSIGEKYFSGLCGRTEIMFEEKVQNFRIITVLASSYYVSEAIFSDVKEIVSAYKVEVEKSLGVSSSRKFTSSNESSDGDEVETED